MSSFLERLSSEMVTLRSDGLEKHERLITSPQDATVTLSDGQEVINLCANNYLGLANHPRLIEAAHAALDTYGYGMASVRFICGTQTIHTALESRLSAFLKTEDTILYSSCFDANTGLFETLLGEEDAIISDALNHASIIDGIRLCKAQRFRYANNDLADLETQLKASQEARFRLIATDGVFSMDGVIANLPGICELADTYDAMVFVDDSHAVGFVGDHGGGTPDLWGVEDRVTIRTGTLGKALGGASGGYTSGPKEVVAWLRQRSRPYLFSNSLAPTITAASMTALDLIDEGAGLRRRLADNGSYFRSSMEAAGFRLAGAGHPIIPVMLGDARVAGEMAARLLNRGVYVTAFSFPVVPRDQARIRTQMSAAHTIEHIDKAIAAFVDVGTELGVLA
jgi:glycine C-acetyltransferase